MLMKMIYCKSFICNGNRCRIVLIAMKKIIYLIDSKINLITILFLFWALFWGLNGFDKFFNGTSQVIYERWASEGYLVEKGTEKVVYSIQPSEKVGWYGVSRDAKFANYLDRKSVV